jgi:hypothetical protein
VRQFLGSGTDLNHAAQPIRVSIMAATMIPVMDYARDDHGLARFGQPQQLA